MTKSIILITLGLILAGCQTTRQANVETGILLILKNPSATASASQPLTFGVPFPKGYIDNVEQLALFDEAGSKIPVQEKVTARWPQDGSVSWVLFDCPANLSGDVQQKLYLKFCRMPETETHGIESTVSPDKLVIDTGTTIFQLNRIHFNLFDSVKENGIEQIQTARTSGPFLRDRHGKLYTSAYGKADEVIIEENGPLRTVVKASGFYYSKCGDRLCRYQVRIHFFAGKSYVKLMYTFINTVDRDDAIFSDIGLKVPFMGSEYNFGNGDCEIKPEASRYLLQYDYNKYLVGNGRKPRLWHEKGKGTVAPGWVKVQKQNTSILLYITDFAKTFPNELEVVGNDSVIYHMWPKHGAKKKNRKLTESMYHRLWYMHEGKLLDFRFPKAYQEQPFLKKLNKWTLKNLLEHEPQSSPMGIALTSEIHLGFGLKPKEQQKQVTLWENPPSVMPTPDWMCNSGVFGKIHDYDPARFPVYESAISRIFDWERRMQDQAGDYGKFNYGDSHTSWNFKGKFWDVHRCWRGYHHNSGSMPWLLYMRSGNRKYLKWAIANSRHLINLDICHWSTPERESKPYPNGKIRGALCDYKGLSHWNSGGRMFDYNMMTDFMFYYYYMTGDQQGYDVALMWANAAEKRLTKGFSSRSGAGVASSMLDVYKATGQKRFLRCAEKCIDAMLATQNMNKEDVVENGFARPYGSMNQWQGFAPWITKYYELKPSKKLALHLCAWADAYMAGNGDASSKFGYGLELDVLSYAYFISKNVKYLARGVWISQNFITNSIIDKPGDPQDGCVQNSISMATYFISRLPVLMAGLADYKKMVEPNYPNEGFRCYPQNRRTLAADIVFNNPGGIPFKVFITGFTKNEIKYTIKAPSGDIIIQKSLTSNDSKHYLELTIPITSNFPGTYHLAIEGIGIYKIETDPRLKMMFKNNGLYQQYGGTQLYFKVPGTARKLDVKLSKYCGSTYFATSAELLGPDGKRRRTLFNGGGSVEIPETDADKIWSLRGRFGADSNLRIIPDKGTEINYLAPTEIDWFAIIDKPPNPEHQ